MEPEEPAGIRPVRWTGVVGILGHQPRATVPDPEHWPRPLLAVLPGRETLMDLVPCGQVLRAWCVTADGRTAAVLAEGTATGLLAAALSAGEFLSVSVSVGGQGRPTRPCPPAAPGGAAPGTPNLQVHAVLAYPPPYQGPDAALRIWAVPEPDPDAVAVPGLRLDAPTPPRPRVDPYRPWDSTTEAVLIRRQRGGPWEELYCWDLADDPDAPSQAKKVEG